MFMEQQLPYHWLRLSCIFREVRVYSHEQALLRLQVHLLLEVHQPLLQHWHAAH